jgi:hypothetical protein
LHKQSSNHLDIRPGHPLPDDLLGVEGPLVDGTGIHHESKQHHVLVPLLARDLKYLLPFVLEHKVQIAIGSTWFKFLPLVENYPVAVGCWFQPVVQDVKTHIGARQVSQTIPALLIAVNAVTFRATPGDREAVQLQKLLLVDPLDLSQTDHCRGVEPHHQTSGLLVGVWPAHINSEEVPAFGELLDREEIVIFYFLTVVIASPNELILLLTITLANSTGNNTDIGILHILLEMFLHLLHERNPQILRTSIALHL